MPKPPSTLDESVINRLVLANRFRTAAVLNADSIDPLDLAAGVVEIHDCADNVLGAGATHLHVDAPAEKFLETFDKIGGESQIKMGPRTKLVQLNSLRNGIKHHGIMPNIDAARSLITEINQWVLDWSRRVFGVDLATVSRSWMVRDATIRAEIKEVEALIGMGDVDSLRSAIQHASFILFRHFEVPHLHRHRSLFAAARQDPAKDFEFPELMRDAEIRLELIELGIDPLRYSTYYSVAPKTGMRYGNDEAMVLKYERSVWHAANWTREVANRAAAFLVDLFSALERRGESFYAVQLHSHLDRITFRRDSIIYEDRARSQERLHVTAGTTFDCVDLDIVDGNWQSYGEPLVKIFYRDADGVFDRGYFEKDDLDFALGEPNTFDVE